MLVLLDENVPADLRLLLTGHEARTVRFMKWLGLRNGELLARAAQGGFEALVTFDSNMASQQNRAALPIAIVVLRAPSNTLRQLTPLVPDLLRTLEQLPAKSIVFVGTHGA